MAGRNELVYDEDDYVPPGYVPPKPARGSKPLIAVVIVGLILGAFVVVFLMRNRERARFARMEMIRAQQNAGKAFEGRRSIGGAIDERETESGHLLSPLVGVWSRPPEPERMNAYPHRLEFRPDLSGTITQLDPFTGQDNQRDVGIRLRSEPDDSLTMQLRYNENGAPRSAVYRLRLKPDDILVLSDEFEEFVFTRQK